MQNLQNKINKFELTKGNIKQTLNVIKSVIRPQGSQIDFIIIIITGSQNITDYFVNIGPNFAKNIPDSDIEFHNFLKDRNPKSLFLTPVIEEEVKDIVNNLNTKKSSGYDGITNFL